MTIVNHRSVHLCGRGAGRMGGCAACEQAEDLARPAPRRGRPWVPVGVLLAGLMAVALVGCATERGAMPRTGDGPVDSAPYRVGPVTVLMRPQPEVEFFCRLRLKDVSNTQRVMGCYLPDSKTIISVPDAQVLLHEFKHHFEGRWHE